MRSLIFGAAFVFASASAVLADDTTMSAPAAPATPADAATPVAPTTPPVAGSDPMAVLFGNSLIVKGGGGPESHTRYSADHTFEGVAPEYNNYPFKGTWEITADGKLCRTFNPEVPGVTNPDCDAGVPTGHALGDTWTDDKGRSISIVAGVQ